MKIIDDQHTIQSFKMTVHCSHCNSTLQLESHNDLHSRKEQKGTQLDPYDVVHLCFRCCLCNGVTRLTHQQEDELPRSVFRAVIDATQEKD